MKTIAFYSYKGGTGRTLVVANAAKYLLRLGLRVFAIDLDLEAPGLHYKLRLDNEEAFPPIARGAVDLLSDFIHTGTFPDSLASYTVRVQHQEENAGEFHLMPAGNVPCASYWRTLAQINWHQLFYSDSPVGIPFFLELKERIRNEFSPDFLLIDSRTGITEIGGVATSVLPDQLVCLLMNNRENVEGARAVLRSVSQVERMPGQAPIEIVPVLSRLPAEHHRNVADAYANEIRDALCEPADPPEVTLNFPHILTLHSDSDLQCRESLRIGSKHTVDDSPLLRDYLRLFSQLVPKELVEPHLGKLLEAARRDMLDNPDGTQNELEAIASYCPHPESYLALLRFYRLRNADPRTLLRTAARYWELSGDTSSPLLWEIVRKHTKHIIERQSRRSTSIPLDFIEAIWRAAGEDDVDVGLQLADAYFAGRYAPEKGVDVLERLLAHEAPAEDAVVGALDRLITANRRDAVAAIINRFKDVFVGSARFQAAWVRSLVEQGDAENARCLLESKGFRPAKLQADNPLLYARFLRLTGQHDELDAAMKNALMQTISTGRESGFMSSDVIEIARFFVELGKKDELEQQLRRMLPKDEAEHFIRRVFRF